MKKFTYKQKLFLWFFLIFAVFAVVLTLFEQKRAEKEKQLSFEKMLDANTEIIRSYIAENHLFNENIDKLSKLLPLFPAKFRVTIADKNGKVLYDNDIQNIADVENHLSRPEIRKALLRNTGSDIRLSATIKQDFYYYAKNIDNQYFIRVALPYNSATKQVLKTDKVFIYFALVVFLLGLLLLNIVANRFSKSITQLREFTREAKNGEILPKNADFQDDELGEIGKEIRQIFEKAEKNRRLLSLETDKLQRHLQYSEIGLAIFNNRREKVFANTHFVVYLSVIAASDLEIENLFSDPNFAEIAEFLNLPNDKISYLKQIEKNGKTFAVQALIFDDKSFEISIQDVSEQEKNRHIKQELTTSIAHELRTPVTALRGYLETLNEQHLSAEKQQQFLARSYSQTLRLSELIDDISLITKIQEAAERFAKEKINILQIIKEVVSDLDKTISANESKIALQIAENKIINGNYTLLYAIFRNLIENACHYAGKGVEIQINNYREDSDFLYFSFADNGIGVETQHLNRLFERFYRVDNGRGRDSGGSGLGLSIVKNAVLLHSGEIHVKNRTENGLEFLFTLKK